MGSVWITLGWVGFGASGGLFPELRAGIIAIGCCRGSIADRMQIARQTLHKAVDALRWHGARP
jgi:hypothetical protein